METKTKKTETEITPVWHIIGFDETNQYVLPDADAKDVLKIINVYLFDSRTHHRAVELTPSYLLIHLYTTIELREGLSEKRKEYLYETWECGVENESTIYVHISNVVRCARAFRKLRNHRLVRIGPEDGGRFNIRREDYDTREEWYEELEEKLCDHYRGNHMI